MGKRDRFGNSLGDKLEEAWKQIGKSKESIIESIEKQQTSKGPKDSLSISESAKKQIVISKPAPPQKTKNPQLSQLRYDASTKHIKTIIEDYLAATQTSRKRTIVEGIRAHYYDMQNKPTKPEEMLRLHEIQELLKEIQEGRIQSNNQKSTLQVKTGEKEPQETSKKIACDKAPDIVKKSRSEYGNSVQFSSANHANCEICDVVIGLDFGTACSKIVVRTPFIDNRAFIIPFGKFGHMSCEYLLPTHTSLKDNHYFIPLGNEKASKNDLKMRLIGSLCHESDDLDGIDNAIAYLALILRYVRTWFLREQKEIYGRYELDWHINIGIPSATAKDENLCHLYHQTVAIAWALSVADDDITVHSLMKIKDAFQLGKISEEDIPLIKLFPEMAAEVAGYTQSDLRLEGLHLLLDVGAGTLDICGFNVVRIDNENRLPLFSTSVEPNGVKTLHYNRKQAVITSIESFLDALMPDPATPLKDLCCYIPDNDFSDNSLAVAEESFFHECKKQLFRLAQHLKRMHPSAHEWKSEFRVFLCGGGSTIPFYRNLIDKFSEWLRQFSDCRGAILMEIPREERIHGNVPQEHFHRFSVAIGLSHYAEDFDRVMTNIKPVIEDEREEVQEPWFMKREYAYLVDY